jgi:hypothetical protein
MTEKMTIPEVLHNTAQQRFEIHLNGDVALADYRLTGDTIIFPHTEVPPKYEGRGIASKLAHAALEYARTNNYHVRPLCSFIVTYIDRHPEYQPLTRR